MGEGRTMNSYFRKAFILVLALACIGSALGAFSLDIGPDQVIVITIDGARPDVFWQAFDEKAGPLLGNLVEKGVKGYSVDTVNPSITPVAHASLFSGSEPATFNYALPPDGVTVDTLFQVLDRLGKTSVFIDAKGGRLEGLEVGAAIIHNQKDYRLEGMPEGQSQPMGLLIAEMQGSRPDLAFLLLPMSDFMGHKYGSDSQEYREAIAVALEEIERLLKALDEAGSLGSTAVVITADHGMTGRRHDDWLIPTNREVPLIMAGPGFKQGYSLQGAMIIDVAPTLAKVMGVPALRDADGTVLREALANDPRGSLFLAAWVAGLLAIAVLAGPSLRQALPYLNPSYRAE